VIRRGVDVVVAASVLVVSSPLLLVAAVAIRLTSRGPVIYRQRRVGRDGAPFEVLKLRTMVVGAEHIGAGLWVDAGDARITRVGAFLRRTSLDELPNLWNVLRGEMSLIGPRPTVPEQVEVYTARQRGRLAIKPGITGWAQVNGRAALPWGQRIELDLDYIARRSLLLDLRIVARTVKMLLGGGEDLYRGQTGGWDLPHVEGYEDAAGDGSGGSASGAPRK
jgi:lipopolysaccharide/colanic/teichoic acid biosynthesis glycosyltransferase